MYQHEGSRERMKTRVGTETGLGPQVHYCWFRRNLEIYTQEGYTALRGREKPFRLLLHVQ